MHPVSVEFRSRTKPERFSFSLALGSRVVFIPPLCTHDLGRDELSDKGSVHSDEIAFHRALRTKRALSWSRAIRRSKLICEYRYNTILRHTAENLNLSKSVWNTADRCTKRWRGKERRSEREKEIADSMWHRNSVTISFSPHGRDLRKREVTFVSTDLASHVHTCVHTCVCVRIHARAHTQLTQAIARAHCYTFQ